MVEALKTGSATTVMSSCRQISTTSWRH